MQVGYPHGPPLNRIVRQEDEGIGRGSRIHPIDLYTIEPVTEMGRQVASVLYVVAMAAVIVGVDILFFRNRFWERLTVNIGIVLVFAAFYFRFLRRP